MYRTDEQEDPATPVHQERSYTGIAETTNALTCGLIHIAYEEYCRLGYDILWDAMNLLQPASYVMHQQFNIQQLYALHTLYLCVL